MNGVRKPYLVTQLDAAMKRIARDAGLAVEQVSSVVRLLDEQNTVPFITRYRKDQTGGCDEEQIREIQQRLAKFRQLDERKATILRSIESQGKLTEEIKRQLENAATIKDLEDVYLPFKPKKHTLAESARQKGLASLAEAILSGERPDATVDSLAAEFTKQRPDVSSDDAIIGVGHIIAEQFSESAPLRLRLRQIIWKTGHVVSGQADEAAGTSNTFKDYFSYREKLTKIPPHRILALNRGERAKALKVRVEADNESMNHAACETLVPENHRYTDFLVACVEDSLSRLVLPSLEREIRRELTERAEAHAVRVFARNIRHLLLQGPVHGKRILAIDPGFKNGCKMAVLDEFGSPLDYDLVFLVGNESRRDEARIKITDLVNRYRVSVVAIGNGTGCRETEEFLGELLANELKERGIVYVIVNEAGASVYSTSQLGREELPECDASMRGAASIGRRLLDPLSELVKIDPASIGVGLYQHDIKTKHLRESLDDVVESCVNFVGVELNSASPTLLKYVSGLNQLTARRIFEFRVANGPFRSREQLKEVPGIGEASFIQSAGFLKISKGDNPLDRTWIHPESYAAAERVLAALHASPADLDSGNFPGAIGSRISDIDNQRLQEELSIGSHLLSDILAQLARPGRDPREAFPSGAFRNGILKLEELFPGMELTGTVLNVVDFGAFVDIGLHDSGLVHISKLSDRFVTDPHEVVAVGQHVTVWVREVDRQRRRVSLTMIPPGTQAETGTAPKKHLGDSQTPSKNHGASEAKKTGTKTSKRSQDDSRPRRRRERRPRKTARRPRPSTVKLTEAMQEGREPLRTFGELKQFLDHRGSENDS